MYPSHSRSLAALIVPALLVLALALAVTFRDAGAQVDGFTFGAAGDYGYSTAAGVSFQQQAQQTNLALVLGDLSYSSSRPESEWCGFVTQRTGPAFPNELVTGNHEDEASGDDGYIEDYAACLPDKLGAVGLYAHQYYFDYPAASPLARFILVDPDLYRGSTRQQYCRSGDTNMVNCNWLAARIDEAKARGLWVVVGFHKNCHTVGTKPCEVGAELITLLAQRRVDLVLQGHDHGYQRSAQLATSNVCPKLEAGKVVGGCIVDDGKDGAYTAGLGMVQVIAGAGGRGAYSMNAGDPDMGYVATYMPTGNSTMGWLKVNVTADRLAGEYVRSGGGTYADSFVIRRGSAPATATPTPTNTAQPQPATATPTNTAEPPTATPTATAEQQPPPAPMCRVWATATPTPTPEPEMICVEWEPTATPTPSPTPSPTPTSTPSPTPPQAPPDGFQPAAPYYGVFYYPWFGRPEIDGSWHAWKQAGANPPTTFFSHYLPEPGLYSSRDAGVILWQLSQMKEARQEFAIASWWGPGDRSDTALQFILGDVMNRPDNPYPAFRWAVYYEDESDGGNGGAGDPSVEQIVADLSYIVDTLGAQPAYFRIGGAPVVFVYAGPSDGAGMAARWGEARARMAAAGRPVYVVLKVFPGYRTVAPQPDGWHQYAPAVRIDTQKDYSVSVSPGFWLDNGEAPRLGRNLGDFRAAVSQMAAAPVPFKLVTTWNEWGEGSGVEPARQTEIVNGVEQAATGAGFGGDYVAALRDLLPPLEGAVTATAAPAPQMEHPVFLPVVGN